MAISYIHSLFFLRFIPSLSSSVLCMAREVRCKYKPLHQAVERLDASIDELDANRQRTVETINGYFGVLETALRDRQRFLLDTLEVFPLVYYRVTPCCIL